jgi:dipeptidyl aminopeptidase/acylaminoacyl peptidase
MNGSPLARRLGLLALILATLAAAPASAAGRPVTVDDEMALRAIADLRISPDGAWVAYVVSTPSLEKNEHLGTLFVVPAAGGDSVQLAPALRVFNVPVPAPRLRWSPDGRAVGLLAFSGESPQVFAVPVPAGEPRQLTEAPEGASGFEWSPDGRSLAYLTRDPMAPEEARARQDKSFIIVADAPERPARLVVRDLESGATRTVTPPTHYVDAFSWSPGGRELAYSAAPRAGFTAQYLTRIFAVAAGGGEPRTVVDRPGMNTAPLFSPDGRWIAFVSTGGKSEITAPRSLTVVAAAGGEPRLHGLDDAWVNELCWASDSRSLFVQANDGTFASRARMFEQPIVRVQVADGRAERVVPGETVDWFLSTSADGRRLAYKAIEGRTMGDVFVLDVESGRRTRLTEVNPQLRELALGELRPVDWASFDGKQIWGLLLTPPGWSPGKRLPMLVYLHGGPGGGVTHGLFPQFTRRAGQIDPYPTEAMASAGFAVLFPMPRGGAGYGEAGQRAIIDSWGEADFEDVMAGVDAMVERGIADPDRLGVMGASYGGYLTNWIVTKTGRFKAASAGASISDLEDAYFLSEGGDYMVEYFRHPWENRESYTAHSPLTFVERVTTPLLLQHGERDARVPIAGAWKMYRALEALGRTVELQVFPRGGHVLYEPMQEREQMRRNLEWFERWLPRGRPP